MCYFVGSPFFNIELGPLFCSFQYHGGTNFGRTAGGPFIATSYDYDAPLDEYGKHRRTLILDIANKNITYFIYLSRVLNFVSCVQDCYGNQNGVI